MDKFKLHYETKRIKGLLRQTPNLVLFTEHSNTFKPKITRFKDFLDLKVSIHLHQIDIRGFPRHLYITAKTE